MVPKVRYFGSAATVSSENGFEIQVMSPDSKGESRVILFHLGPTGEALVNLVKPWVEKLAADLDLATPSVVQSSNHVSRLELSWDLRPLTREQLIIKLVELFFSKEFAIALGQLG